MKCVDLFSGCGGLSLGFEKAGFEIVASKVTLLDGAILREHYAHVADQPFFPEKSFINAAALPSSKAR